MSHQPERDPKAIVKELQDQFIKLCTVGMRGADAISNYRDNPKENLKVVKDSTDEIRKELSDLKRELEAYIVNLSGGEQIFSWEYQVLREIASNAGLTVEEINSRFTAQNGSVVKIDLDFTSTTDLTHLVSLSSLQRLWLDGTQVKDLTPLASLSSLQELDLDSTQVSGLTPLANLSSLQELRLWNTQVSDLSPLANLSSLQRLDLSDTQVSDLTPLANLSSLQWLYLNHTPALTASKRAIAALEKRGVEVIKE